MNKKRCCQNLTLPAAPARALQLPEVVARARRVAAERARPLCVQDHALEAAALGRPALEGPREVLVICEDARQGLRRPFHGPGRRLARRRRVQTQHLSPGKKSVSSAAGARRPTRAAPGTC